MENKLTHMPFLSIGGMEPIECSAKDRHLTLGVVENSLDPNEHEERRSSVK